MPNKLKEILKEILIMWIIFLVLLLIALTIKSIWVYLSFLLFVLIMIPLNFDKDSFIKTIKKKNFKKYASLLIAFSFADMFITGLNVAQSGIEWESNLILVFLVNNLGFIGFFIAWLFAVFILTMITYLDVKSNNKFVVFFIASVYAVVISINFISLLRGG